MAKFLRLVNGIMKSFEESGSSTIYDRYLEVVASGAGANQINGPITAGTNITLPSSQTYTGDELQVFLNGLRLDNVLDYNHVSSTQISFLFNLEVTDVLRFYIDRNF
jgi:hypothetical protein